MNDSVTTSHLGEALKNDETNWARVNAMREEDIQRAIADDPDTFTVEDWTEARLVIPLSKESIHLRVDADVLAWFKAGGPGHLSRMNAVLRNYYESKQQRPKTQSATS